MWQVDNDRYQIWRLEHELAPKKIDRLLNSVTTADREPVFRLTIAPLRTAVRALVKLVCALPVAPRPGRRSSIFGGEKAAGGQGTSL